MDLTVTDVPSRMVPVAEGINLAIAAHPLAQQVEHRVVPAGLTLAETLELQGLGGTGWEICVGGLLVPAAQWGRVRVRPGHLVEIRATVGKQVLQIAAIAALSYFTMGAGGLGAGGLFATGGAIGGGFIAAAAVMIGGSVVINKLLAPKAAAASAAANNPTETTFSLSAGSNSPRLYAPLCLQLGECKVVPDLAAQQYTWFEGEDQYLACQLHAGINCGSVSQIKLGDTLLSQYQDAQVSHGYFPSGNDGNFPNTSVDSIDGALLDNPNAAGTFGAWTTRTTSVNTTRAALDIEATLTSTMDTGAYQRHYADIEMLYRKVGTQAWQPVVGTNGIANLTNLGSKPLRTTFTVDFPVADQYEIQVRKRSPNDTLATQQNTITWTQLKSYQADTADYSGQPRVRIEVKASGQLTGALNSVNWMARAAGMPLWNGQAWINVTEPGAAGTSNPGAQILQLMRGIRRPSDNRLMAGLGLPDRKIDLESLKAFMVRCIAKDFRFDAFIQESMSISDLLDAIADVAFGRLSRASGKFGVIWLAEDQPIEGVINMARMKAKSFSVDYDMTPTADELEYQFYDADNGYVQSPVRVVDPTLVGTPQRSSTLAVRGTTRAEQAARRARFTLGQSLYAKKSISFELDLEHLVYPRGKVVSISHDLTQWGYSGRLAGFSKTSGTFTLQLDDPLPNVVSAVRTMGLQLSGEANMRVYNVASVSADGRNVVINAAWPADVPVPGAGRPVRDTVWLFDVKATPGLRARVVSVVPNGMTGAKVTVVPESPELWDYVWNGTWTQPGNASLLPVTPPVAGNASISGERVRVGEAWRTQLTVVFDAAGNYDHAQVWGSADGAPMVLLGETGGTRVSWYADAGRQWSVEVRPFDGLGRLGGIATALYTVATNPPANVFGLALNMTAAGAVATWTAPAGVDSVTWSLTEIRRGANFDTAPVIYSGRGTTVALGWLVAGSTTVWARHKDTAGVWSAAISTALAVQTPAQPNVLAGRDLSLVSFRWNDCTTSQPITGYRVSDGTTFVGAVALGQVTATAFTRNEAAAGRHRYWVVAADAGGNVSAAGSVDIETLPGFEQAKAELTAGLDKTTAILTGGAPLPDPATLLQPLIPLTQVISQLLTGNATTKPADLIPLLPVALIPLAQQQDATNRAALDSLAKTSETLLRVALDAHTTNKLVRDAGIYADPATGTVRIYGVDANNARANQLQILLDAVKGQLSLTATTAYVQGAIAQATLNQTDLVLFNGMNTRVTAVEVTLDSLNGQLLLKASTIAVTAVGARVTSTEQRLDAAEGTLASKVSTADFQLANGVLQGRVGTVEQTLATIGDVASITSTVAQSRSNARALDADAETTLSDILAGWNGRQKLQAATAQASQELRAYTDANFAAQASARLALQAATQEADAAQSASLAQETLVRTTQNSALASQVSTLGAQTVTDKAEVLARLETETTLRSTADTATAGQIQALTAQLSTSTGNLSAQLNGETNLRVTGDSALGTRIESLTAQLNNAAGTLTAQISGETTARVNADGALGQRIEIISVQFQAADTAIAGQVSTEATTRASAVAALASRVDTVTSQFLAGDSVVMGQVQSEANTRAGADGALGQRIDTLTAQFNGGQSSLAAQLTQEALTRASETSALTVSSTRLTAESRQAAQQSDASAETQLLDVLNSWRTGQRGLAATASAQQELRAYVDANNAAEAAARLTLEAATTSAISAQTAAVKLETVARTTAVAAVVTQVETLTAQTTLANSQTTAQINSETTQRTTADGALGGRIDTVTAQLTNATNALTGQVSAETNARVDADGALAGRIDVVSAQYVAGDTAIAGQVSAETNARANADGALSGRIDVVTAQFAAGDAAIAGQVSAETTARSNADGALAGRIDVVTSQYQAGDNSLTAQLNSAVSTQASATQAVGARVDSLVTLVNGNSASVTSSLGTLTTAQNSQANRLDGLTATVGGNTASIATQQSVTAGLTAQLAATWSLRVAAGNKVAGMVINNTGAAADIVLLADRFAVATEQDGSTRYPFIVGSVAGVPTVLVDGNLLATGSVKAPALDVQRLSAVSSLLGFVTAARLEMNGDGDGGWGYARSYSKWLGDGTNGFVMAAHGNGDAFVEFKAGSSRIAMHAEDNLFEIDTPGFFTSNGQTVLRALDVVDTLNLRGQAVTSPAFISGATNDLSMGYTLSGTEAADVFIQASMAISFQSNFVLEVDGVQIYNEVPGSGSLASKGWTVRMAPGSHWIRLFSPDGRNNQSAALCVLGFKR